MRFFGRRIGRDATLENDQCLPRGRGARFRRFLEGVVQETWRPHSQGNSPGGTEQPVARHRSAGNGPLDRESLQGRHIDRQVGCAVPPGLHSFQPSPALPCRATDCAVPSGLVWALESAGTPTNVTQGWNNAARASLPVPSLVQNHRNSATALAPNPVESTLHCQHKNAVILELFS